MNRINRKNRRRKNRTVARFIVYIVAIIFIFTFVLSSCVDFFTLTNNEKTGENDKEHSEKTPGVQTPEEKSDIEQTPDKTDIIEEEDRIEIIRISAVGDIMMHKPQINAGYDDGQYNYDHFFTEIAEFMMEADIAMGNLETTLAGEDKVFAGYPRFNAPKEIAGALKNAGFNVLTTANNHSLDRGEYGAIKTLEHLEEYGLIFTGTARTEEERNTLLLKDIRGVKVAIMSYTYGTNGIPIPDGKDYLVNLIDIQLMEKDIVAAREQGADIIIFALHFGREYRRQPNDVQKNLVEQLFYMGVDIILGSHPHVLQPMEKRAVTNKYGETKECFVIYSLGNFISNQMYSSRTPNFRYTDTSIILNLDIEKNFNEGNTIIKDISYIPIWVDRYRDKGKSNYRVLPIEKAIVRYEQNEDDILTSTAYNRLLQVWDDTVGHMEVEEQGILVMSLLEDRNAEE